jgi:REP element-mobilizing transposase RayT
VAGGLVRLTTAGEVVRATWAGLPTHYAGIDTDEFVVMPNHVHGIIRIRVGAGLKPARRDVHGVPEGAAITVGTGVGAGLEPAPTVRQHGLAEIVRGFKTFSARRINDQRGTPGAPVWQRNYYEHIIRSEEEMDRIREYVRDNPAQWAADRDNPIAVASTGGFETR